MGRRFPSGEPYLVSAEKVREFATAVGSTGDAVPPTFPIVVAFHAMQAFFEDPGSGLALHRIVHGEQRFSYERPLRVGERVTATLEVTSVRHVGGAAVIGTSTAVLDEVGATVCTAAATFVHTPEDDGA